MSQSFYLGPSSYFMIKTGIFLMIFEVLRHASFHQNVLNKYTKFHDGFFYGY